MKKLIVILSLLVIISNAEAQFKKPDEGRKINKSTNNLILGIFNPKNFSMTHSFEVSMMSSRFGNISVTSYINSMNYKFSDRLNVSADVKLQYAPYVSSSFGKNYANSLQNDLNGLSLSRLSLDYKISDNANVRFEFRKFDEMNYYNNYSGYPYDGIYR